jgi:hypothetical protein
VALNGSLLEIWLVEKIGYILNFAEQKAHLNECIYESIKKMIYLFYFGKRARIKGFIPKLHIFGRNYMYNLYLSSNLTADTSLIIEVWVPITPLVNFHKCFISCAVECPDNIYFIQSSHKHNSEV